MKERLLEYLACPSCSCSVRLDIEEERDGIEIMHGELRCTACSQSFPIIAGVPRFADPELLDHGKRATAKNFGWSWNEFSHEHEKFGEELLGWIAPIRPEYFPGKVVLEAGCGKGRHTSRIAHWGARDVVAVDLSDAVDLAFEAVRGMENAHVIQADIYHLPLRREFDYAFSVGVLHHLPDPRGGFESMVSKVKPGGGVSAWIYGAENNKWITSFVNPIRKHITSRMNQRVLFHLSKLPTAIVYSVSKLIYGPLNRSPRGKAIAKRLFYNEYLNFVSAFHWREQHSIVFDHLVAPTAFYIPREEFESWWAKVGAEELVIGWHNRNSWRGFGRVNVGEGN